jgi:hypothetical protein
VSYYYAYCNSISTLPNINFNHFTSISKNEFSLNKVNQHIAEEYNTMVKSDPLGMLAQAAISFYSPPKDVLNSANRSNIQQQQQQQQQQLPSHHPTNYSKYCDFFPILDFTSVPRLDPVSSKEIFINTNTTTICEGIKWAIVTSVLDAGYQKVKDNM